jgi:hypothetical protein
MPTEARKRAERPLDRADECMRLAHTANDPEARANYLAMAEQYLVVARAEHDLAEWLEKLMPTSTV